MGDMYCWICMKDFCPTHPWHQPPIPKETPVSINDIDNKDKRIAELELDNSILREAFENSKSNNDRFRKEIEDLNRSNERQGETIHYLREELTKLKQFYASFELEYTSILNRLSEAKSILYPRS